MATSSGHEACSAEVIMAITLCLAARLNAAPSDRTSAGLFFSTCRSVNGNGTRTTSKRSKLAIGLFVFGGVPLAERTLRGLQILDVDRVNSAHSDAPVRFYVPCKRVSGLALQYGADFPWDRRLALGGDFRYR